MWRHTTRFFSTFQLFVKKHRYFVFNPLFSTLLSAVIPARILLKASKALSAASITGVNFFPVSELDKFPTFVELVGVVDATTEIDGR